MNHSQGHERRRCHHLNMCLLEAVKRCDASYVRLILTQGANPHYHDHAGWTAVHWGEFEMTLYCFTKT